MLFLPISSRISIMLYDSEVYSIRSRDRRSEFITIARDDEERLNKLQMVGDRGVLYLPRPDRHPEVEALAAGGKICLLTCNESTHGPTGKVR